MSYTTRPAPHCPPATSSDEGSPRPLARLGIFSSAALILAQLSACASPPPPAECPEPEPLPVVEPPPAPPAPTAEEVKAKEAQERLLNDYRNLSQSSRAEIARLSPDIRVAAAALSKKQHWSGKSAIEAALKGTHRRPGNAERDAARHPLETLEFFGFDPKQVVIEYGPGAGWYTELLAPSLARRGSLSVTLSDPKGAREDRGTYYGARTEVFLQLLQEAYSKVIPSINDFKAPKLAAEDGSVDMALVSRGMHGMVNHKVLEAWLAEFHRSLKVGGVLAVIQHRAPKGADPITNSQKGYLPEAFVIEQVSKAGFKLEAQSEINANAKDKADHPHGVWSLPPSLKGGDADKAKFVAIGESDRMTLKFVKVEAPKIEAKPAAAAAAKPAAAKPAAAKPAAAKPAAK